MASRGTGILNIAKDILGGAPRRALNNGGAFENAMGGGASTATRGIRRGTGRINMPSRAGGATPTPPITAPSASAASAMAAGYDPNKGIVRNVLGGMGSNLTSKFGDGMGIAKQAGKHALRGAVGGAAIGGTAEWAQGGSFWAGAKDGAFKGAVGWSAYRMAGHATDHMSMNPLSKNGAFTGVSKQVKAIMQAKKDHVAAQGIMKSK
jgi:hypothetical protein